MNPRVLELIRDPKNIQLEDLGLLKEEIHAFPYIQNIRALHLYGVHLYEKENYQKELSTTAAYTTDKKILYQLINGKIKQEPIPEPVVEKQPSKTVDKAAQYAYKSKGFPLKREAEALTENHTEEDNEACLLSTAQEIKPIYVNGERNRILFEGEENFLDDQNSEIIDIESTLESGTLVTQKTEVAVETTQEKEEIQAEVEENAGEDFTPETVINEDEISTEKEEVTIEEEENLSFEETEPILPEINAEETTIEEPTEPEIIVENEDVPVSEAEQELEESDAEVSFHGTEAFLPDVKIQTNSEEITETAEISQPNVNKHEEEMRRLIEEVEKKMKETKSVPQQEKEETEATPDHEISFAETQNFHFWSTSEESSAPEETITGQEIQEEVLETPKAEDVAASKEEVLEVEEEVVPEVQSTWKPMSVEAHVPDSLLSKPAEIPVPVQTVSIEKELPEVVEEIDQTESAIAAFVDEEILPVVEETADVPEEQSENSEDLPEIVETAPSKEEAPVMNVSFFGSDISSLSVEERQKENKEEPVKEKTMQEVIMKNTTQAPVDSNVPGFINTWQSWLKIDRTEDIQKEKIEIKEKAIETFIENNPRISQLKEESTYVVKEKNDDISHLMTETLANLYFEQKLYTKAIKAFEILIKKTPEKKKYFESKIQEIKDFRSKN